MAVPEKPVPSSKGIEGKNPDYIFTQDLILYVVNVYYSAEYANPQNDLKEQSSISPFSTKVKLAVETFLDAKRDDLEKEYDLVCRSDDGFSNSNHMNKLLSLRWTFESKPYDNASFLEFLCKSAVYTCRSYMRGIANAIKTSLEVIYKMLCDMRVTKIISNYIWKEFEAFCDSYVQEERPKTNPTIPKERPKILSKL